MTDDVQPPDPEDANSPSTVVLRWRLTLHDTLAAAKDSSSSSRAWALAGIAGSIFGAGPLYRLAEGQAGKDFVAVTALMMVLPTAWYMYLTRIRPRRTFRQFAQRMQQDRDYVVVFSDRGIHAMSARASSDIAWDYYATLSETPHFYWFVRRDGSTATSIPKRVFDDADERAFRTLAERHLGPIQRLTARRRT